MQKILKSERITTCNILLFDNLKLRIYEKWNNFVESQWSFIVDVEFRIFHRYGL